MLRISEHHSMLERETELIKQIIVESTIDDRQAITLAEVVAAELPRGVKSFMSAEVAHALEQDFRQSSKLSQIAKTVAPTISRELSVLRSLSMEYVISRDEYIKLVEDTVHFLENYLCRPQWTLNQFLFEHESTISFTGMLRKFEFISDYPYYAILVERTARSKGWTEMSADRFRNLIERIDEEVTRDHSPRQLALLAKPIFQFLLFGDVSPTRPIPVGAILLFYGDKNLMKLKEYVERMCQFRSRNQLSMKELIEIIEDLYHVESIVKEDVRQSEQEIFSPAAQSLEPVIVQKTEPEEIPREEPSAENKVEMTNAEPDVEEQSAPAADISRLDITELEKDMPGDDVRPQQSVNVDILTEFAAERTAKRHAMFLTFPERPEKSAVALPDADDLFTEDQREKFIKTVFKNDSEFYGIFLASIDKASTWRAAQVHLRELFEMNKLDILSRDVIEFTDAMHSRYKSEST